MTDLGSNILIQFKRRWQVLSITEMLFYALGPSLMLYVMFNNWWWSIGSFIIVLIVLYVFKKPWTFTLEKVSNYIDQHLQEAEYSSSLLLKSNEELSGLANLQKHRIIKELPNKLKTIKPPHHIPKSAIVFIVCVVLGFLIAWSGILQYLDKDGFSPITSQETIFKPIDSTMLDVRVPKLDQSIVTVRYPKYTNKKILETSDMNIKAVEGSRVSWKLNFKGKVDKVVMESLDHTYPMKLVKGAYTKTITLTTSGFYNFKFTDTTGASYISDLYAIEVLKDKAPEIEILELKQFTTFSVKGDKIVPLESKITDDFGLRDAYIIATVSKGSGESVKFREEKLRFENKVVRGSKQQQLSRKINLDKLKMEPGDELYFYVEAVDRKYPKPNISRSETYFAVIKDTVTDVFAVEGTMGVDLMPDYFRSQRQLIIDTEKLINDKPQLAAKDFKFRSNELGFDQKSLRIKYGQFMGDESEFGPTVEVSHEEDHHEEDHHEDEDHHDEEEEKDPLEGYTHKHDTENEHNLVDHNHDHEEEGNEDEKTDPLEEFLHNHSDPEESTLFAKSLKSKLRQALTEMWDAELYLRLYKPEKSLPYQYRALKLIQEIKNSARIYVHRIGFDPPPIKEDKRLTGEIKEVKGYRKTEEVLLPELYPSIKTTIDRLEKMITERDSISDNDQILFGYAGNELAKIAIDNPGNYLEALQHLKTLTQNKELPFDALIQLQKDLFKAIPDAEPNTNKQYLSSGRLQELLLKELEKS